MNCLESTIWAHRKAPLPHGGIPSIDRWYIHLKLRIYLKKYLKIRRPRVQRRGWARLKPNRKRHLVRHVCRRRQQLFRLFSRCGSNASLVRQKEITKSCNPCKTFRKNQNWSHVLKFKIIRTLFVQKNLLSTKPCALELSSKLFSIQTINRRSGSIDCVGIPL